MTNHKGLSLSSLEADPGPVTLNMQYNSFKKQSYEMTHFSTYRRTQAYSLWGVLRRNDPGACKPKGIDSSR
jgi:hypothetical protein